MVDGMIVKICGIRTLEDARTAIDAGTDMLGFNFYRPSPRYIEPGSCATLVKELRREESRVPVLVGVFVNMPVDEIETILRCCELDLAQLHGDESPETLAELRGCAFKAVRPANSAAAQAALVAYRPTTYAGSAPDILLDASAPGMYGGSGQTADWSAAATLAHEARVLLAGGLHPGNVAAAIKAVRPWGVDVASGVESAPGVKDAAKMRLFVDNAKATAVTF